MRLSLDVCSSLKVAAIPSVHEAYHRERWILVELTYGEREGFTANQYEQTFVYACRISAPADLNIVSGDGEVLFQVADMTLLWDYAHSSFTGWRLEVEGGHAHTEVSPLQRAHRAGVAHSSL